jgi:hypothetical protein
MDGAPHDEIKATEWPIEVTEYFLHLAKKCQVKRALHEEASAWYDVRYNAITISAIVLTLVIASVSALPLDGPWFKYAVSVMALVSASASSIIKKLGYEALMQRHLLAAQQFLDLRETIEVELTLSPSETSHKAFIRQVSQRYRAIVAAAPSVLARRLVAPSEAVVALTPLKAEFGEQACEV